MTLKTLLVCLAVTVLLALTAGVALAATVPGGERAGVISGETVDLVENPCARRGKVRDPSSGPRGSITPDVFAYPIAATPAA
jgi:hypothetical protein